MMIDRKDKRYVSCPVCGRILMKCQGQCNIDITCGKCNLTKKSTISAYENDKIDIKVSVLKDLAKVLCTNVSYLVDGDENDIAPEIMQVAVMLQEIQNKELRKVAIEQMKILVGLNDTFK